jgi:hypothetical protein
VRSRRRAPALSRSNRRRSGRRSRRSGARGRQASPRRLRRRRPRRPSSRRPFGVTQSSTALRVLRQRGCGPLSRPRRSSRSKPRGPRPPRASGGKPCRQPAGAAVLDSAALADRFTLAKISSTSVGLSRDIHEVRQSPEDGRADERLPPKADWPPVSPGNEACCRNGERLNVEKECRNRAGEGLVRSRRDLSAAAGLLLAARGARSRLLWVV